jgi:hypothetical protein
MLASSLIPIIHARLDICLDCGTVYAFSVEISEIMAKAVISPDASPGQNN